MTDPDESFRRPQPATPSHETTTAVSGQAVSPAARASEKPLILDPELHQSVWKPWQSSEGTSVSETSNGHPTTRPTKRKGARTALIVGAMSVLLALVVTLVVPRLIPTPSWWSQPLVADMATKPVIAWQSEGGEPCFNPPNDDEAILTDTERVWALDLTTGETIWSMDFEGRGTVTCLPGANRVAVAMLDTRGVTLHTQLLDAASGAVVAELSGDTATQVIPLGSNIGLVDNASMLRVVDPAHLDTPLWSRDLEVMPVDGEQIEVKEIDDAFFQLSSGYGAFTFPLGKADGASPMWSQGPSTDYTVYRRAGDVIIRSYAIDSRASILDLEGRELWRLQVQPLMVAGSRLYVSSAGLVGLTNLREVDPHTGDPINEHVYKGSFAYTIALQNHIATLAGDTLSILDEHLQAQPTISVVGFSNIYEGKDWVYAESDPSQRDRTTLSAIDVDEARVLWELDLERGQSTQQIGRHLIIVDADGTLRGLKSP